ncbi:MAG: bacteriochlorophyll 4-vinyl reductase [Pseudomonadota bacterium]
MFDGVFRQPPRESTRLPAAFPSVGPNTITQTAAALAARGGYALVAQTFAAAGVSPYIDQPPTAMVPEGDAARLHGYIHRHLPNGAAILHEAGRLTADYLLANRIPRPAQWVLQIAPAPLSAWMLATAIRRHAWTFAGSGRFEARGVWPLEVSITANALSVPECPWHQGVFEGLFRRLVSRRTRVTCLSCCATGAPACTFAIGPG